MPNSTQQAWYQKLETVNQELYNARGELVTKVRDSGTHAETSTYVPMLSAWYKISLLIGDPNCSSACNKALQVTHKLVEQEHVYLSDPEKRATPVKDLVPNHPEYVAVVETTVVRFRELDLMAASVYCATTVKELKELLEFPPNFGKTLNTAVKAHKDLRIKFALVKVVGNEIVKENPDATVPITQAEFDEYMGEQLGQLQDKLEEQMKAIRDAF